MTNQQSEDKKGRKPPRDAILSEVRSNEVKKLRDGTIQQQEWEACVQAIQDLPDLFGFGTEYDELDEILQQHYGNPRPPIAKNILGCMAAWKLVCKLTELQRTTTLQALDNVGSMYWVPVHCSKEHNCLTEGETLQLAVYRAMIQLKKELGNVQPTGWVASGAEGSTGM